MSKAWDMNIYFSASTRNIKSDIHVYRKIIRTIQVLGHVISRDWVETAYARELRHNNQEALLQGMDWTIVEEAEKAIEGAELLIAEASDISTFGVGYEVAYALQRRKPVLLLANEDVAARSYAIGIRHKFASFKKYNHTNLAKVVERFINENTVKNKDLRFNFVIDRTIHTHLRSKSFETGKTKAEILRDLLLKDMNSDSDR
ncbi:MAG TPA: hypothetical protein VFO38_03845 [Candidatus Saccharimonadales bacterium]|nr:hypothetical protein [Candidatus Saccharimonadales bacterium]